jgi:hypothetical protein
MEVRIKLSAPHGFLGGKTPVDRMAEMTESTPLSDDVEAAYGERHKRIRHCDWQIDKSLAELDKRVSALTDFGLESHALTPEDPAVKKVKCRL